MSLIPAPPPRRPSLHRSLPGGAIASAAAAAVLLLLAGCAPRGYDPSLATDPYPVEAHRAESVDIQLFRDGPSARLVNATVTGYQDVRLWLNQRWVRAIPDLPPGAIVEISLDGFRDERGEQFVAGGFFRTERRTPIVMAQLERTAAPDSPLVGLRVISPIFEGN